MRGARKRREFVVGRRLQAEEKGHKLQVELLENLPSPNILELSMKIQHGKHQVYFDPNAKVRWHVPFP